MYVYYNVYLSELCPIIFALQNFLLLITVVNLHMVGKIITISINVPQEYILL